MRLKDKVAFITGANSGIGLAIAKRFAAEGARVGVNFLPGPERAASVAAEVAAFPVAGLPLAGDVTQRADVERMVAELVAKFGRVDVVVNNAGIEVRKPFLDGTDEEWNRVIGVNLFGAYLTSQVACRQIVKQDADAAEGGRSPSGGKLIFVSSVHEDIAFPGCASYCASKGAIRMLMRNLAMELAPHKINVNNIAPGAIATPINEPVLDDPAKFKAALGEIPWGRFGQPAEVASVALFLASAESDYVTGSTYYVDGGMTRQVTKY
jgi:glucose 1-dehydrogenase